jgi:F-type H+-transporting ATPase subunit alpha
MTDNIRQHGDEIGFVKSAKRYLLTLEGLPSVRVNDVIQSVDGYRAIVTGLERERVHAQMLDSTSIEPGEQFVPADTGALFSFGDHLFGRTISALGDPIDTDEPLGEANSGLQLDVAAPGIDSRTQIAEQFYTGITLVDTLLPIGKGQRQLMFGPIRSGKDEFVRQTIVNQANTDTICIYAAIGKPRTAVLDSARRMFDAGAGSYTVILAATSEDETPLITIAPSVAFLLAEHFMAAGKDVLLVLDDLGTHAKYLREAALLQGRLPGRESYPGDIFYQHAHLMERSGAFSDRGALTLFPVLETDIESYTDLIPTNLMASTDGHFSFLPEHHAAGIFPAISEEESVTRVGKNTQYLVQKQLSTKALTLLTEYREQREYSRFGAQMSQEAKNTLRKGQIVRQMLRQHPDEAAIATDVQVIYLGLVFTSFFQDRDADFVREWESTILKTIRENEQVAQLRERMKQEMQFETFIEQLEGLVSQFEQACQS